jgi:hypothetical protein
MFNASLALPANLMSRLSQQNAFSPLFKLG